MNPGSTTNHELPERLESLDIEACPVDGTHFFRVAITEDAADRAIAVPVLIRRAAAKGPVVGITAAIHGNELNGLTTIHQLFASAGVLDELTMGTVVAVPVLNIPGYLRFTRQFHDGADLNRIMPGKPKGNSSQIYAHRLLDRVIRHFDVLIDLHTASFGRVNTLYVRADMSDPTTAKMARALQPQIIVHNPPGDGTLRGAAEDLGIHALTLEIGDPQRTQLGLVRASRLGIQEILEVLGMLPDVSDPDPRDTIECKRSYWIYTEVGGVLTVYPTLGSRVKKGDVVAHVRDLWGRDLESYAAPEDGVVVGKSTNPAAHAGARILHLGVEGQPEPKTA